MFNSQTPTYTFNKILKKNKTIIFYRLLPTKFKHPVNATRNIKIKIALSEWLRIRNYWSRLRDNKILSDILKYQIENRLVILDNHRIGLGTITEIGKFCIKIQWAPVPIVREQVIIFDIMDYICKKCQAIFYNGLSFHLWLVKKHKLLWIHIELCIANITTRLNNEKHSKKEKGKKTIRRTKIVFDGRTLSKRTIRHLKETS